MVDPREPRRSGSLAIAIWIRPPDAARLPAGRPPAVRAGAGDRPAALRAVPLAAADAAGVRAPPAGIVLDTAAQIEAQAPLIKTVAVDTHAMPLGNATADDRRRARRCSARWLAGALEFPAVLEIVAAGFTFRARFEEGARPRPSPRSARSCRSRTGSSTAAGAASRTGSRGATASSASAPRTRRATRRPGELLLYPGGISETELLFPYGHCAFGSKAGAARRQPLRDGRRRARAAARARPAHALGRRAADLVPRPVATGARPGIDSPRSCGRGSQSNGGEDNAYEPIPAFDAVPHAASDRGGRRVGGRQHAAREGQAREGDGQARAADRPRHLQRHALDRPAARRAARVVRARRRQAQRHEQRAVEERRG